MSRHPIQRSYGTKLMSVLCGLNEADNIATMLIDTGATFCSITPDVAKMYGISPAGQLVEVTGIAGKLVAPECVIDIWIGDHLERNVRCLIMPMSRRENACGVIGMTLLERLDFMLTGREMTIFKR